jgi:hypothetical protein
LQLGRIFGRQQAQHRDDQAVPDLIVLKRRQMIGGELAWLHCALLLRIAGKSKTKNRVQKTA